jgi:hypothetical protein
MQDQPLAANRRIPAENRVYAQLARTGLTPEHEMAAVENMRKGRRAKAAERIIACDGQLPTDGLERRIDAGIRGQMIRARAAALTARRKSAAKLAAAAAELTHAIGDGAA